MSTAKCEERVTPPQGPRGIRCYFATKSGGQVDCQVTGTSSRYEFEIENHRQNPVGIKIKCESDNGHVEFKQNGSYQTDWEDSILLEGRSTGSPATDSFYIEIQPATSGKQTDEIDTELNVEEIVLTPNPSIDEEVKVDVN